MLNKRFFKTKDEAEVTFEFSHPEAEQVCLLGEFTDWQPVPMKLNKKQGVFKFKNANATKAMCYAIKRL